MAQFREHSRDHFRYISHLHQYHTIPFQQDSTNFREKQGLAYHLNVALVESPSEDWDSLQKLVCFGLAPQQ